VSIEVISELPVAPLASRVAAGKRLVEEARNDPRIWLLTADVARSTGLGAFVEEFPTRFINVGIAEQTMVGIAAGLATCGKHPYLSAFAAMLSLRACEQIRTDVAYPNLNVKIFATHSGLALAKGGTTHHATEDLAIMRSFANMTVVVPCDMLEAEKMISALVRFPGPAYIRLRRGNDPLVHEGDFNLEIGKAVPLNDGNHITIIGCGRLLAECLIATRILAKKGIHARLLDMHTVKPIDSPAIEKAAHETEMVFTVEDHNILGGLGGAVAEVMAELGNVAPLYRFGFRDVYAGIGPEEELLDKHGLSGIKIATQVQEILLRRGIFIDSARPSPKELRKSDGG
jgi:transketolase